MEGIGGYTLSEWLLFFYIYCFIGWIWESCYVSARKRHWVNRGFLKGPLLPIYGSGAVVILAAALPLRQYPVLMVLGGMAAATLLEYVTGAAMEAIFKARYWDYTGEFLNLKGYICLKSSLCWGVMTLLLVYAVHPPLAELVTDLSPRIRYWASLILTALTAGDFATSFQAAMDFRNLLLRTERLREELKALQARMDQLEVQIAGAGEELRAQYRELQLRRKLHLEKLQSLYSRRVHGLLRRNPGTVSRRHKESLEAIRRMIRERVEKDRK